MAIAFIASVEDLARARNIEAAIASGDLPEPPALQGKANECANCHKMTVFARFYIPRVGHCCEACFDEWRTTPVWCSTRADDVHIGRVHTPPTGLFELYDEAYLKRQISTTENADNAPVARCSAQDDAYLDKAAQVCRKIANSDKQYDAMREAEKRWTAVKLASYARRGNAMLMPWRIV